MPDEIYTKSVTANDLSEVRQGAVIRMIIPFMQGMGDPNRLQMPPVAPPYWSPQRDMILRSTVFHEAMWAASIGIALTKTASLAYEVTSDVPRRAKDAQELLLTADGRRVGWVGFLMKHLRDFLNTDNGAFVEIVRASKSEGSKIIGLKHLDSLRCCRTGDPDVPVIYRDRLGMLHELQDYQVVMLSDMPDPGDTYFGTGLSAASRAYNSIFKLSSIEWYLREKVSGLRPLAIHIVNGVLTQQLKDAVATDTQERVSRGVVAYMGATIVGIPGGEAPQLVTIPLAELPERFDRKQEFDISLLTYANCIGLDPQDLQPLSSGNLGTSTQSQVLAEKSKAKGLAAWKQDFTHALNTFVFDDKTTFAFTEKDYRDQEQRSSISKMRTDNAAARITAQLTTPAQELQILVDQDEIPKEFLPNDVTPGMNLSDTEKPADGEDQAPATAPQTNPGQLTYAQQQQKPQEQSAPVDVRGKITNIIGNRKELDYLITPEEVDMVMSDLQRRMMERYKGIVRQPPTQVSEQIVQDGGGGDMVLRIAQPPINVNVNLPEMAPVIQPSGVTVQTGDVHLPEMRPVIQPSGVTIKAGDVHLPEVKPVVNVTSQNRIIMPKKETPKKKTVEFVYNEDNTIASAEIK